MPHLRPRVSVIVPTYNRAGFLAECLESLLRQSLPPWQLLVVDDGATDATRAVLAGFADRVTVLRTRTQCGKPGAANLGLAHVTGDYVWLFDDDDVALPDALERLVDPLERDRSLGFSFSSWFYADSRPDGRIGLPTYETRVPDLEREGFLPALLRHNYLGGAALFLRRSSYEVLGGYDPTLVRSQDFDMAIRAVRRFRGARAPGGATFLYRQHPGERGSSADRFPAGQQFRKWLEYDRRIIRRLRQDLRPGELLPPGWDARRHRRLEQIEYVGLMAGRVLAGETVDELRRLAGMHGLGPLSRVERAALHDISRRDPWYAAGSVLDCPDVSDAIAVLARQSPFMRAVRRTLVAGLGRYVTLRGARDAPARLPTAARRARRLFAATSTPLDPSCKAATTANGRPSHVTPLPHPVEVSP